MISDSPSGRSKGRRFVSAKAAIKKIRNPRGCIKMPQRGREIPSGKNKGPIWVNGFPCCLTISPRFRLEKIRIIPMRERLIESS